MTSEMTKIEVDGFTWYWQEVDFLDGTLRCVRLYDKSGEFVCEFNSHEEMMQFLR